PPKSLRLCDLGFFELERLAEDQRQGIHFVSRIPALLNVQIGVQVAENVATWLDRQSADRIDTTVVLGTKSRLGCRLIAVRLPEEEAQKRLHRLKKKLRKKGRKLSDRQRVMGQWTVLITDLPAEEFTLEEICVLYRVRWQVELLYKAWKSGGGVGRRRGRRGYRGLCEADGKLLAMGGQHWGTLRRGGAWAVVRAGPDSQTVSQEQLGDAAAWWAVVRGQSGASGAAGEAAGTADRRGPERSGRLAPGVADPGESVAALAPACAAEEMP